MKRLSTILEAQTTSTINGFVILKPGFLSHKDAFITLLENNGWQIIQKNVIRLTMKQAKSLYLPHVNKDFYEDLCRYMCSDDCLCCTCYKDCSDPIKEMTTLKKKVRDRWGEDEMRNAMHSSDSIDNVTRESNIVFNNLNEGLNDSIEFTISQELQALYAEEINAFYQYWVVAEFLVGAERPNIQEKYREYAMDELVDHAQKLLTRMNQLNINPSDLLDLYKINDRATVKYVIPNGSLDTTTSLLQNINAEEAAIKHYKEVIKMTDGVDVVTCEMLKEILKDEEEHLSELVDFANDITKIEQL